MSDERFLEDVAATRGPVEPEVLTVYGNRGRLYRTERALRDVLRDVYETGLGLRQTYVHLRLNRTEAAVVAAALDELAERRHRLAERELAERLREEREREEAERG